jgi:PEP-CTERM motif
MRPITFLLLIVAMLAIIALSAASAQAQALPLIFFDENGNVGTGPGFPTAPTPGFGTDPLSTGPPSATLYYVLPFPVVTGDVQLTEPPTGISDLVRFEGPSQLGPGVIFFYSDNLDGGGDVADVGLPTLLTSTPTVIAETGPNDNNNGATYIPTPGMPGFPLAGPPAIQYNIISDVPEPSSILLAGLGGGSLLLALRRRNG